MEHGKTHDDAETRSEDAAHRSAAFDDPDNTPRSEVPCVSPETTPAPAPSLEKASDESYFALHPSHSQPSASLSSFHAVQSPSTAHNTYSHLTSPSAVDFARRLSNYLDFAVERPAVQRDGSNVSATSIDSTDSTITVTGSTFGYAPASGPRYPNQAFSALQQQRYPPPHLPPTLRTKSFHPAKPENFRQAIQSLHQSGSRTADNTPAATPGLFSPTTPTAQSDLGPDEQGFYASPFLHYTHRQAPKETHIADVDIDPISGRKLINNYEIIDELGRGTHGKVKLGRNLTTNEYVAIKIVERYSKKRRLGKLGNAEDKVKKEVAILKKARHPNIVALLEVIDDPARKKVYIVLERVELGEIVWRAVAPKEIALIESRRYDRESQGIFDDQDAEAEDRALLEEARGRRVKQQRRALRRLRRQKLAVGTGPQAWSFEFGGDTDEDDSDMEKASRASTATTETSADLTALNGRALSRAPTPGPRPVIETAGLVTPTTAAAVPQEITDQDHEIESASLEGTMYGSYDDHSILRAPSLASSVLSFGGHDLRHGLRDPHDTSAADLMDSNIHIDLLYVPCMTIQAARVAFRDVVLGLQYLHWQGIIHRDIKPPNLLQTIEHRTKISDFGVSYLGRPINEDQAENLSESDAQDFDEAKELAKTVGTAAFYAPELCYTDIIPDGEKAPSVGKAIDVWALGVTLFCMLFGRTPFVDSEYVVMRRIADEVIYIPDRRLKPVEPHPKSRPSSHGRCFPAAASGRRFEFELAYEELDDVLIDLLRRLLVKDPDKRITLDEVRHHPWVIQDIPNKAFWLDESDPARQAQGKKIQISKEELQDAVVPVKLVERIRSGLKKTVGGLMSGLGRAGSTRQRGSSNAGSSAPSASSSGSAVNQDERRSSLRGDESIFSALKASRESEHPLSQSVTASPDQAPRDAYFSNLSTPGIPPNRRDVAHPSDLPRPTLPDRAKSIMSTTASVRTVRASDGLPIEMGESPPLSPVLTNASADSSTVQNLGGLLSGAGRRILQSVRERSTAGRTGEGTNRSLSRAPSEAGDPHTDPSVAVTNAFAAGQLDPPEALKNITPASSSVTSPVTSRSQSVVASESRNTARLDRILTRQDSSASLTARRRVAVDPSSQTSNVGSSGLLPNESTAEEFRHAEDEWLRKRLRENREMSSPVRSLGARSPNTCPPSPDDELFSQRRVDALRHHGSSHEASPTSTQRFMTPSSSDDRFHSGSPMTRSNPSIPSVTTVDSELPMKYSVSREEDGEILSPHDTLQLGARQTFEDEGYAGDGAIDSDEEDDDYEDSSDEDGGLQMIRRKSIPSSGHAIGSSNRHRTRRETGLSAFSKKSSRSGSNNTMKKVRTREEDERESSRGRTLSSSTP